MELRLDALAPGQTARLDELRLAAPQRARLEELGLLQGTKITCLYRAPRGTIAAYEVGGAVFALRRAQTARMTVVQGQCV